MSTASTPSSSASTSSVVGVPPAKALTTAARAFRGSAVRSARQVAGITAGVFEVGVGVGVFEVEEVALELGFGELGEVFDAGVFGVGVGVFDAGFMVRTYPKRSPLARPRPHCRPLR